MKKAVFAGTFDPFTKGHYQLLGQALSIFDEVIVAVCATSKSGVGAEERKSIALKSVEGTENVTVEVFDGLLVDYMFDKGCNVLLRGLRNTIDFEYEKALGQAYKNMMPSIQICYLMSSNANECISSSLVRQILSLNGDITSYISDKASAEIIKAYGVKK